MSKYKTTWTELRQHMSEMELAYVVRYLDPKNGKRFAVPFKTQPDANKKRDQLKRDGAQQLSITKDYLKGKFKEDVSKDSAYAIGMAKAKDMYNDEPPVDKKTVTKAHDIAKAILRKEEFITEEQLIEQDKQDIQEFSRSQLDALARQYSDLKGKTISIDNANKLRKIFDKIPNHFLNDLRKKHIPFLSGLALSRMVQKGIPVKEDREIAEGFEWHTLSFLKRKGFNVARFSYGKLLVPKSDVEDVKKLLKKETEKVNGDVTGMPNAIIGEAKEEVLDEGLKIANLVGQCIAHLGMYVELAEDVKKEYFKTKSQVSSLTKIKADQVLTNVPKLIKELRKPGIWNEEINEAVKDLENEGLETMIPNKKDDVKDLKRKVTMTGEKPTKVDMEPEVKMDTQKPYSGKTNK